MTNYTKTDEFYNNKYDRYTIADLKAFEQELILELKDCENEIKITSAEIRLKDKATDYAKNKRGTIGQWKDEDLRKDRLIAHAIIPSPPYCSCGREMQFFDYDFLDLPIDPHFIFSCPFCKKRNKILNKNGEQYLPKLKNCNYCKGNIKRKIKKSKAKMTIIEVCLNCNRIETSEYEFTKAEKILPINEFERTAYCKNFEGRRGFYDDLKAIANWAEHIEIKPNLSEIEILKLPKLEEQLSTLLKQNNFTRLNFQQPKVSETMVVEFSVEDITERNDEQASKALKKILTQRLLKTNWRLMSTEIISRMGYLSGRLKGFDQPGQLNKLISERLIPNKKR